MNQLFVKNFLISAVVVLCMARPRDRRDVRLADAEESVNDFKELFKDFGSNSPDARATHDVHSSGDNSITICWNERTVVQLYKNGDLNGYVDYSISLQLAPFGDAAAPSNANETELYEVKDIHTDTKRVLQFVTTKQTDDVTIKENRTSNCRLGQMYSRTFLQLPSKKRVEIKLRSQLYKQDFQSLSMASTRTASSAEETRVVHQRIMVSSEEMSDREALLGEARKLEESAEVSSQSGDQSAPQTGGDSTATNLETTTPIVAADPNHSTLVIEVSPQSAAARKIVSKEESSEEDISYHVTSVTSQISGSESPDITISRVGNTDESGAAMAEVAIGERSEKTEEDYDITTDTESMAEDSSKSSRDGEFASPRKGADVATGNYLQLLDSQSGGSGETASMSRKGGVLITGNYQLNPPGNGKVVITGNYIPSLDSQAGASVEVANVRKEILNTQTGGRGQAVNVAVGPIIGANLRSLDSQTAGSGDAAPTENPGAITITGNYQRSLDSGESGISVKKEGFASGVNAEGASVRTEGGASVTDSALERTSGGTGGTASLKKEGTIPITTSVIRTRIEPIAGSLHSVGTHTLGGGNSASMRSVEGGAVTGDSLGSLEIQTAGGAEVIKGGAPVGGTTMRKVEINGRENGETPSMRKEGDEPITGNYMLSLDSTEGITGSTITNEESARSAIINEASGGSGKIQTNPVMSCEDNNKLKVKVRFDIVDQTGEAKNVEKQVELDMKKYKDGNKGDNLEDALHSLIRSYYGETLNKYIDECVAAKNKKTALGAVMNRALQDDFYVDPQNSYLNPYENVQSYQYQNPKINSFEVPAQPQSGSFYVGTDGRYYVVHGPQEPLASESLITKIARTLKSALAGI